MSDLRPFVQQVHQVYSAIARKIEELIVSLNEAGPEDSQQRIELCRHINAFLGRLEKSVTAEWNSAGAINDVNKRKLFLKSIQQEITNIKRLKAFVSLASRKPKPVIIRKIHALYREVDSEIGEQEVLAA